MFSIPVFREQFPAFSSELVWPNETIQSAYDMSGCYIDAANSWYNCTKCQDLISSLMTAHLLTLNGSKIAPSNNTPGKVASAAVGSVNVSFVDTTASKNAFTIWLSKTPYGEQLLALLGRISVGPTYIGGTPERSAFRKYAGRF